MARGLRQTEATGTVPDAWHLGGEPLTRGPTPAARRRGVIRDVTAGMEWRTRWDRGGRKVLWGAVWEQGAGMVDTEYCPRGERGMLALWTLLLWLRNASVAVQ